MNIRNRSGYNKYVRFSTLALQMGLIIGLATWGGTEIDEAIGDAKFPIWTLVLSLSGVGGSLYLAIREVIRMGKEEDEENERRKELNQNNKE